MKKIGILGGTSAASTLLYYETITSGYTEQFNDFAYPEILLYSVSFQQFVDWQRGGEWDQMTEEMVRIFKILAVAGADFGLIASNTFNRLITQVAPQSPIPLLSIIDPTATAIKEQNISTVGLLGTMITMKEPFYCDGLRAHGLTTLLPAEEDQQSIHQTIYRELVRGRINRDSKAKMLRVIARLVEQGAEGIILGCTEIPLLINSADCEIPLFDTARLHAQAALRCALDPEAKITFQ
ncbi:amino acid racemase [Candidatus Acetothermia bacterium]|nr:amino acid racemase [Candidatus Acetothermia bacterium]